MRTKVNHYPGMKSFPKLPFSVLVLTSAFLLSQDVGQSPSETFTHDVTFNGETVSIDFVRFSSRGPLFEVLEHQADGSFLTHTADEVRTYIGTSSTHSGVTASAIIRADGSTIANLTFADGSEWYDDNGSISERTDNVTPRLPTFTVRDGGAGSDVHAIDILVDLPHAQMVACGGTVAETLEMAEFSFARMNALYLRDTAVINRMGKVIVRTDDAADPYDDMTTTNQLLSEVGSLHQGDVRGADPTADHDLAFVASVQVGGGLASVGTIGTGSSSNGSSSNGDFSVVGRHEIGHNWSLGHFDGGTPEGRTINSGNSLGKMSGPEIEKVLTQRDSKLSVIHNLGAIAPSLPPRAADDVVVIEVDSAGYTFSPLQNDNDVNGSSLELVEIAVSKNGITATIDPNDSNSVIIPAPAAFSNETDTFDYTIRDADGFTSTAVIHVKSSLATDSPGHWTFERTTNLAQDSTANANHGTLEGDAQIIDGKLVLDGDGDYAKVEGVPINSNSVTLSSWVYRDGDQGSLVGLIFSRAGNVFGMHLDDNHNLRYHWDGGNWGYNSGLTVPDQTWTFVAMTVEPDQATFYMDTGNGMQSVTRSATHPPMDFSQQLRIGMDPNSSSRSLKGQMDDVRVFDETLSAEQIADLAARGIGSRSPFPVIGDEVVEGKVDLQWQVSALSNADRIYISDSYNELRNASIGSAADRGLAIGGSSIFTATPGTYYWRVDSTEDGQIVKGETWAFEVIENGELSHWPLDETSGSVATDRLGGRDGTIQGSPELGAAGASNGSESSHCFDGDEYIEVPFSAELNPDRFTVSLWAKVDGGTSSYRSPLTSRDSGGHGYIFYATPSDRWAFWVGNGSGWTQVNAPDTIVEGQWYHLVGSYDGSKATFYIDGEVADQNCTSFSANTQQVLRIGSGQTESSNGFDFVGCIDDVRIWNRALGSHEIQRAGTNLRAPAGQVAQSSISSATVSWGAVPDAVNYTVYESADADFANATEIGYGPGTSLEIDDLTEGETRYFWVSASDGINTETTPTPLQFTLISPQPDLTVGQRRSEHKGDNIYNTSAAGQTIRVRSKGRRTIRLWSRLQNDSDHTDSLRLRGRKSNRYIKLKYYRKSPSIGNISSKVYIGQYQRQLAPGQFEEIQIQLKPTSRLAGRRKSYTFHQTTYSSTINRADRIKARIKVSP